MSIIEVNSTRLDPSLAEGPTGWISVAMNCVKEWAGIGALLVLMLLACWVCLWCICRIRLLQRHQAAMLMQAFTAIEAGQSPQVWLAAMEKP